MAATLSTRLSITARALAQLWQEGRLASEQLRDQMRRAIAEAHTVALLAGTDGQRNAEIDTALREIIQGEYAELDRLITLLEGDNTADVERRLLAFSDTLDETRAEGQRLTEGDSISPLVPIAVGAGLTALLGRVRQQPASTSQRLPRIDSRQLRQLQDIFGQRLDDIADQFANDPDAWHEAMQRELRIIHEVYAQAGGGSINDERIRQQLEFLDGFRGDLDGLTPEQIKRRARQYIGSGQATLQEAATQQIGMPVLPAYPKDGTTECVSNCRCYWDIETLEGSGNFNATWKLRPAEHCTNCVTRASVWSPIRIRNGIIQPFETVGVYA